MFLGRYGIGTLYGSQVLDELMPSPAAIQQGQHIEEAVLGEVMLRSKEFASSCDEDTSL